VPKPGGGCLSIFAGRGHRRNSRATGDNVTFEPDDIVLDKSGQSDPGSVPPRGPRPVALMAAIAVLALAIGAAFLYLRRTPPPQPAPRAAANATTVTLPAPQAEAGEQIELPPLDQSDALVRQLVERLSSHPTVAGWLMTDGLILNFAVVTSKLANGETPASELKAIGPVGRFRPRSSGSEIAIDPASYRRYDRYAQAVASIDAQSAARLYATLKPRVGDAYQRLGRRAGEPFDPVLERAIVELLKVPVVEGDVALDPHGIGYAFVDPRLEQLSDAQKQLLRMGPQNVRIIQNKLREIAPYLGIPESRLPPR